VSRPRPVGPPPRSASALRSGMPAEATRGGGFSLTRTSHRLPAAAADAPHPAGFSRFGVLDVPSSTPPRPTRSGRSPQRRPLRAPWPRIPGAATTAMSSITEERQRRRRGHGVATLWADGGRGRSLRCSSSTMLGHRLPPRALTSAREPHRRMALGTPAGPLDRKPSWARHLAALATKPGEKCGFGFCLPSPIAQSCSVGWFGEWLPVSAAADGAPGWLGSTGSPVSAAQISRIRRRHSSYWVSAVPERRRV